MKQKARLSWNKIRKLRNDLTKLNQIYYSEKYDDKTKKRAKFYLKNKIHFDSMVSKLESNQTI